MAQLFFIYILANKPRGALYIGVTNDPPRRLSEHRAKLVASFTARYGVTRLVHIEEYATVLEEHAHASGR